MRMLLGAVGAIAVAAGTVVAARTLRGFDLANAGAALARAVAVAVAALAIVGGVQLLRGAVRGRIVHRRNAPSSRLGDGSGRARHA